MGYDLAAWESFAVAEVGAAAALAGLVVVAASINIERIMTIPTVVARVSGTLALFAANLVAGIVLLIPAVPHRLAGALLALTGILAALAAIWPRALRHMEPGHRATTAFSAVLAIVAAACIAVAGFAIMFQSLGGLYWFAPGVILAFVVGLGNSWVALIEIRR